MPTPIINYILRSGAVNKYALDFIPKSQTAAAYAPRRLRSSYTGYPLRIRDDTGAENDIPFCGENLCTGTMLNWLQRNQVASIPLGTDGNSDGVSDGWNYIANSFDGTVVRSCDGTVQKLEITVGGTNTNESYITNASSLNCKNGNIVTLTLDAKVTGDVKGIIRIDESPTNDTSALNITNTSWETKTLTVTVDDNDTSFLIKLRIKPNAVGSTGYVEYRNISVTISNQSAYVTTWYDQSGNNNHAVQTTAANQPRIVNAGIIDRDFDATKANALYPTFASASGVTLVSNGDFSNGTTGWTGVNATASVSGNTYSCVGNGGSANARFEQQTSYTSSTAKKIHIRFKARVTNANCTAINCFIGTSVSGGGFASAYGIPAIANPTQNTQYTYSGIVTLDSTFIGNIKISPTHQYADAATANGKVMEVQEVVCVDVTELGMPCVYFDGSNDVLSITNSASVDILSAPMMINAVLSSAEQTGYILAKNADSSATNQYAIAYATPNNRIILYLEGLERNATIANTSVPINTQKLISATFNAGVQQNYINGNASGASGNYNGALTSRANMQIGARSNNAEGTAWASFFKGNISEIIILIQTSGRSKLEKNQGKYYGVAVA